MNWGVKIVIALALFMALIISFGIYMVSTDTDSLVHEDYYERGLNYDRLRNVDSLQQAVDSISVISLANHR
ncbi:FixH family protein [Parapedobacter sp.]